MIKKHAKDLIVLLIIAIVITVAILCMDIKTTDEYYAPSENQIEGDIESGNSNIATDNKQYAYIEISCLALKKAIDNNKIKVSEEIAQFVPEDGNILKKQKIELEENDTAFSVLKRVAKQNKITVEHDNNSSYVKGINNIREFTGGRNSGWMIAVNGKLISCSAGQYKLKENDVVSWFYTCDYTEG